MKALTQIVTATPIKTRGIVPLILKARIKHLETLTALEARRMRHDGAKDYVSQEQNEWFDDKGITS